MTLTRLSCGAFVAPDITVPPPEVPIDATWKNRLMPQGHGILGGWGWGWGASP